MADCQSQRKARLYLLPGALHPWEDFNDIPGIKKTRKGEGVKSGLKGSENRMKSKLGLQHSRFTNKIFARYSLFRRSTYLPRLIFLKAFNPFYTIKKIRISTFKSFIIRPRFCINHIFGATNVERHLFKNNNWGSTNVEPHLTYNNNWGSTFVEHWPAKSNQTNFIKTQPGGKDKQAIFQTISRVFIMKNKNNLTNDITWGNRQKNINSILSLLSIINNLENKKQQGIIQTFYPFNPVSRAFIIKNRNIHTNGMKLVTKKVARFSFRPVIPRYPGIIVHKKIDKEKSGETSASYGPFNGIYQGKTIPAFSTGNNPGDMVSGKENDKTEFSIPVVKNRDENPKNLIIRSFPSDLFDNEIILLKHILFPRIMQMNSISQRAGKKDIAAKIFSRYHHAQSGNTHIPLEKTRLNIQGSTKPEMIPANNRFFRQGTFSYKGDLVYNKSVVHKSDSVKPDHAAETVRESMVNQTSLPITISETLKDFPEKKLTQHLTRVADRVYKIIEQRIMIERERRGLD